MLNVTDSDYNHVKIVCNDFEIKNLGEYQDLYLKSDTLLLTGVFENFKKMCFYILSKRFFLTRKGLSDARIASIAKKKYGFAVHFL